MSDAGIGAQHLHRALAALNAGDSPAAHDAAMEALHAFGGETDRTGAAAALQILAIVAVAQGRFEEALGHVDAALPLRESSGDIEGVAALWQERMELCLRLGELDDARKAAEMQVAAWARTSDREGSAHAHHQLAQLLLQLGDLDAAEATVQDALFNLAEPSWARARSALRLLYGNIWLARGDHARALAQARQGLDEARSAKHRPAEIDAIQACGVIHAAAGEYPPALRALQEALVGRELLKDQEGKIHLLRELAGVELAVDKIDDALEHFDYAARLLADGGDVVGEITVLQLMQTTAEERERPDAALSAAHRLLAAASRTGDREAEAGAHFALAARLAGMGALDEAQKHFRTARDTQEVLGLPHEAAVSAGMLGQVLVAAGQRDEGLRLLRSSLTRLEAMQSEAAEILRDVLAEADPG